MMGARGGEDDDRDVSGLGVMGARGGEDDDRDVSGLGVMGARGGEKTMTGTSVVWE